jgi:tetratricopeptide (TPR) repeat protein
MRKFAILLLTAIAVVLWGNPPLAKASDDLESYLLKRIQETPQHSDSWRLLGDYYHRQHRDDEANEAFKKSLELDPDNAATHFNWGQLLEAQGDSRAARDHFQRVYQVAPESEYAESLHKMGYLESIETSQQTPFETALYEIENSDKILQAGYEIQTFDASEDFKRRLRELDRDVAVPHKKFRLFLETGVLWNSNVTLTPISRQLVDADASSFQGFFNPEIEWRAWDSGQRRGGPLLRGFFTKNEQNLSQFDLASFQPGVFFEQDLSFDDWTHVARFDYVYAVDLLDGDRFGDRHSATASVTTILPDLDAVYSYATVSFSQFDAPVIDPGVNSLNGPAFMAGCSRFFRTDREFLPLWSLGADLEYVNAEGDDFRYLGGKIHADATFQLADRLELIPSGNVGFRSYPDFTGVPARDELTYRLSSRLRYRCSETWSVALVVNYDRFASDNDNFNADRFESGIVTTFLR